jgi:hypothetical protein
MIGDKNHPVTVSSAPIWRRGIIPAKRKVFNSKEKKKERSKTRKKL